MFQGSTEEGNTVEVQETPGRRSSSNPAAVPRTLPTYLPTYLPVYLPTSHLAT